MKFLCFNICILLCNRYQNEIHTHIHIHTLFRLELFTNLSLALDQKYETLNKNRTRDQMLDL